MQAQDSSSISVLLCSGLVPRVPSDHGLIVALSHLSQSSGHFETGLSEGRKPYP